jgi:hypothetical protein
LPDLEREHYGSPYLCLVAFKDKILYLAFHILCIYAQSTLSLVTVVVYLLDFVIYKVRYYCFLKVGNAV